MIKRLLKTDNGLRGYHIKGYSNQNQKLVITDGYFDKCTIFIIKHTQIN